MQEAEKRERIRREVEEKEREEIKRQERIKSRGTIEEFTANIADHEDVNEQIFASILRKAQTLAQSRASQVEKFNDKLRENPSYALSWSASFFDTVAEISVAEEAIQYFDSGATLDQYQSYITARVMNSAQYPSRSTSATNT